MADQVGLCEQNWNETIFDGSYLVSCPSDKFQLLPKEQAADQPDLLDYTSPVATCNTTFSEITSGTSQLLSCSESDFQYISRHQLQAYQTSPDSPEIGSMSQIQFDQLWLLLFICGLLMAFGLGAIKGGQR